MTIIVDRKESMSPDGTLRLFIQDDGDVVVTVNQHVNELGQTELRSASVEFCTYSGGGGSTNTHRALRQLAVAMAKDNEDPGQAGRRGEFPGTELLSWASDLQSRLAASQERVSELEIVLECHRKRVTMLGMLILAASHLLKAATGPEDGPTSWSETRAEWLAMSLDAEKRVDELLEVFESAGSAADRVTGAEHAG